MSAFINGIKVGKDNEAHYFLDRKEVTQEEYESVFPPQSAATQRDIPAASGSWTHPMHSEALAVHPKQIEQVKKEDERRGVGVDYDGEGRPIFRSRQERNRYMKAYNVFDRDGGYGDPQFTGQIPDPYDNIQYTDPEDCEEDTPKESPRRGKTAYFF